MYIKYAKFTSVPLSVKEYFKYILLAYQIFYSISQHLNMLAVNFNAASVLLALSIFYFPKFNIACEFHVQNITYRDENTTNRNLFVSVSA